MFEISEEQNNNINKILKFKGPGILFVTGPAGTGKSLLLKKVQDADQNQVTLAPTGSAALQARGVTIDSFFGIKPGSPICKMRSNMVKVLKKSNRLLIDEISMVRSDKFELINLTMQEKLKNKLPFGGIPVIVFGDLFQIEPICKNDEMETLLENFKSHFFFDSLVAQKCKIEIINLKTIYRQKNDIEFIEALQSLRIGKAINLEIFNKRISEPSDDCIRLTYTNKRSAAINQIKLNEIKNQLYTSTAVITGNFNESEYPAELKVNFKLDAKVMLVRNNYEVGNEYVNGDMGVIVDIMPGKIIIMLDRDKRLIQVEKHTWEKISYEYVDGSIYENVVGTFTQIPIKLGYSSTVHKIQGATIHGKVHLDLETKSFASGLLYVSLSRATKLDNLTIGRKIYPDDIILNERVVEWCEEKCI